MTNQDWLSKQSHSQLVIFVQNLEYKEERLRDKLFLLTGCRGFGDADGMDGGCVECSIERPETFERCMLFQDTFHKYRQNKRSQNS